MNQQTACAGGNARGSRPSNNWMQLSRKPSAGSLHSATLPLGRLLLGRCWASVPLNAMPTLKAFNTVGAGQAHASATSVSNAPGNGSALGAGRATDVPLVGASAEAEMVPGTRRARPELRWRPAPRCGLGQPRSVSGRWTRPPRGNLFSWGGAQARSTRVCSAPGYGEKRRWRKNFRTPDP